MSISSFIIVAFIALCSFGVGVGVGIDRGRKLEREKMAPSERALADIDTIERHIISTVNRALADGNFDSGIARAMRRNNERRQA